MFALSDGVAYQTCSSYEPEFNLKVFYSQLVERTQTGADEGAQQAATTSTSSTA